MMSGRIALMATLVLLVACASGPRAAPPAEVFEFEYEFTGNLDGALVGGTFWFEELDDRRLRYTMISEDGICNGEVQGGVSRVQLTCRGLRFEFARGGRVQERGTASLAGTRTVRVPGSVSARSETTAASLCAWNSAPSSARSG